MHFYFKLFILFILLEYSFSQTVENATLISTTESVSSETTQDVHFAVYSSYTILAIGKNAVDFLRNQVYKLTNKIGNVDFIPNLEVISRIGNGTDTGLSVSIIDQLDNETSSKANVTKNVQEDTATNLQVEQDTKNKTETINTKTSLRGRVLQMVLPINPCMFYDPRGYIKYNGQLSPDNGCAYPTE